jgi:hypothetical protein
MSEMLANQYFMARKYRNAAAVLEKSLLKTPDSKAIRSKLIICYTQMNEIGKAWDVFFPLAIDDPEVIMNMDPIRDDCPCPDLVDDIDKKMLSHQQSVEHHLHAGMLWLFCDVGRSVGYLEKAMQMDANVPAISQVINVLRPYSLK